MLTHLRDAVLVHPAHGHSAGPSDLTIRDEVIIRSVAGVGQAPTIVSSISTVASSRRGS